MALSANRNTQVLGAGGVPVRTSYPVAASTHIYEGGIVCLDSAGNAVAANTSTGVITVGVALKEADNSSGAAAAISVPVEQGVFCVGNHSSLTKSAVGALVYIYDDSSVQSAGSVLAGTVYLVDSAGIWVYMGLDGPVDASGLTTFESNLASTSHAEGASLVGVEDAAGLITAATVEDALTELVKKVDAALGVPVCIPVVLAAHSTNSIAARFTPGFAGKILGIHASVVNPVTTGSKLGTFTPAIAATPTTGGALALTSSNCTPVGAKVDGSAITAANSFTSSQEITIIATSVTAFVEGEVVIYLFLASA